MAATAIAVSTIQSPSTWTASTLDDVLIYGHAYFCKQNILRPLESQPLPMNADEIQGTVDGIFGCQSVTIQIDVENTIYGMLNKFKPRDRSVVRLHEGISQLLQSESMAAIITCNGIQFKYPRTM